MILLPVPGELCIPVYPHVAPRQVFLYLGDCRFRAVKEEPRSWWGRLWDKPPRLTLQRPFYEDPAHFAYIPSPYRNQEKPKP